MRFHVPFLSLNSDNPLDHTPRLSLTSEQFCDYARALIRKGKAYVCDQNEEETLQNVEQTPWNAVDCRCAVGCHWIGGIGAGPPYWCRWRSQRTWRWIWLGSWSFWSFWSF